MTFHFPGFKRHGELLICRIFCAYLLLLKPVLIERAVAGSSLLSLLSTRTASDVEPIDISLLGMSVGSSGRIGDLNGLVLPIVYWFSVSGC